MMVDQNSYASCRRMRKYSLRRLYPHFCKRVFHLEVVNPQTTLHQERVLFLEKNYLTHGLFSNEFRRQIVLFHHLIWQNEIESQISIPQIFQEVRNIRYHPDNGFQGWSTGVTAGFLNAEGIGKVTIYWWIDTQFLLKAFITSAHVIGDTDHSYTNRQSSSNDVLHDFCDRFATKTRSGKMVSHDHFPPRRNSTEHENKSMCCCSVQRRDSCKEKIASL